MDITKQQQKENVVVDQFAKSVIDKVFKELALIFPAWKNNWSSEEQLNSVKLQWTKAFIENGICTIEQIQAGFSKARQHNSDFLPSCGKFISWCEPLPEDMGWPSVDDALKQCIRHRTNQKMFAPQNIYIRPMIIELCKRVDWWLMETASEPKEIEKSNKHFYNKYMELLSSGYVEPKETEFDRLPTQQTVEKGMSEQQKKDKRKRDLNHIKDIKNQIKKGRQK